MQNTWQLIQSDQNKDTCIHEDLATFFFGHVFFLAVFLSNKMQRSTEVLKASKINDASYEATGYSHMNSVVWQFAVLQ